MAHFSATFAMAGPSDMTRFGSLEFPTLPPVGMRIPPVFKPSQAFLFESLDFVTDRLGVLHLHEETLVSRRATTSMTRYLHFIPSKLSAQTSL